MLVAVIGRNSRGHSALQKKAVRAAALIGGLVLASAAVNAAIILAAGAPAM